VGATLQGLLGPPGDRDVFRVSLKHAPPGKWVRLSVTGLGGVAMEVSLLEVVGEGLVLRRTPKKGEDLLVPNLLPSRMGDALLLSVKALSGANTEQRYAVKLDAVDAQADVETEPNDSRLRALAFPPGVKVKVRGLIDAPGDEDWWSIDVNGERLLKLDLSGVEGLNLRVEVWNGNGETLAKVDDQPAAMPEVIPGLFVLPGKIFLRVSAGKDEARPDRLYELDVALEEAKGFEHEPNNAAQSATLLPLTGPAPWRIQGYMVPAGDVDTYKLDLTHDKDPRALRIALKGVDKNLLRLTVTDATGTIVTEKGDIGPGEEGVVAQRFVPGVYFVAVQADKRATRSAEPYSLTVTGSF